MSLDVQIQLGEYRRAALVRIGDAHSLRRRKRYGFAMYAAGVAAECMLRAFRRLDRPHSAKHGLVAHFKACDEAKLGEPARKRIRNPIATVRYLWLNNFRFKDEAGIQNHLKQVQYYENLIRGSDSLKVACGELVDAATTIVTVGDERWRNLSEKK
ncbi:MAG: hypothetical protein AB7S68_19135 [Polyangiaceae bacterium]